MNRQPHRAGLVHQRPLDGLADPPGRIGRKTKALVRVEFFHGANEAEIAFLDQVQQGQAAIHIMPRDLDYQPKIALDHALPRARIARQRPARKINFLCRGEQG